MQNIYADHYQMQICSQLLEDFPIEVEWILHQKPESDALINRHKPSLLKPLAGLYQKFLQYISPREAILYGSYFTQKEEQLLSLYSLGKIAKLPNLTLPELKLTPSNRSTLQSLLEKEGMEPFLARLTSLNLPLLWLEGFPQALAWVNREFPPAPRRIFSSGGIHEHDGFKIWTALASEKGSLLYLAQHGGNYGVLHQIPYHIIEKDCADRFLSWGWQEDRVLPFPSIKLSRIHAPEHNHSGRILFAASSHCRYPIDPYYFQDGLEEYKQNQSAFVATLEAELRERLLCRFHWSDSGWNLRHNLENKFPDLMFDTMDIPFLKSLFQSSLYVCDLLSTTYLEAFVANHPTILFLQKIECPVAQSAKPLIQSLYEQKIIHFDPVSAAQTINIMGQNPLEWWMQKDRQKAVQNFTSVYAKTTPDYLKQYRQLLLKGEI